MTTPTERMLRDALTKVRAALTNGQPAITDTVWMDYQDLVSETVVDHIDAVLAATTPPDDAQTALALASPEQQLKQHISQFARRERRVSDDLLLYTGLGIVSLLSPDEPEATRRTTRDALFAACRAFANPHGQE